MNFNLIFINPAQIRDFNFAENFLVNLTGNPIQCDCKATELKMKVSGEDMESSYHRMFRLTDDLIVCSTKSAGKNVGKYLQEVNYADLNCPIMQMSADLEGKCSNNCSCSLNRYYRQTMINCSYQHFSSFPFS